MKLNIQEYIESVFPNYKFLNTITQGKLSGTYKVLQIQNNTTIDVSKQQPISSQDQQVLVENNIENGENQQSQEEEKEGQKIEKIDLSEITKKNQEKNNEKNMQLQSPPVSTTNRVNTQRQQQKIREQENQQYKANNSLIIKVFNNKTQIQQSILKSLTQVIARYQKNKHPNLLHIVNSGLDEQKTKVILTTKYMKEGNLFNFLQNMLLQRRRFGDQQIWNFIEQLVNALQSLHDIGIVHKQIKTSNIFIDCDQNEEGILKLGLIGIRGYLDTDIREKMTSTPYHRSPEALIGKPEQKSDIWSLGCVLYEMMTFQTPFFGDQIKEVVQRIKLGKYAKIDPNCYQPSIISLVYQMMSTDPNERPTCQTILKYIQQCKTEEQEHPAKPNQNNRTFQTSKNSGLILQYNNNSVPSMQQENPQNQQKTLQKHLKSNSEIILKNNNFKQNQNNTSKDSQFQNKITVPTLTTTEIGQNLQNITKTTPSTQKNASQKDQYYSIQQQLQPLYIQEQQNTNNNIQNTLQTQQSLNNITQQQQGYENNTQEKTKFEYFPPIRKNLNKDKSEPSHRFKTTILDQNFNYQQVLNNNENEEYFQQLSKKHSQQRLYSLQSSYKFVSNIYNAFNNNNINNTNSENIQLENSISIIENTNNNNIINNNNNNNNNYSQILQQSGSSPTKKDQNKYEKLPFFQENQQNQQQNTLQPKTFLKAKQNAFNKKKQIYTDYEELDNYNKNNNKNFNSNESQIMQINHKNHSKYSFMMENNNTSNINNNFLNGEHLNQQKINEIKWKKRNLPKDICTNQLLVRKLQKQGLINVLDKNSNIYNNDSNKGHIVFMTDVARVVQNKPIFNPNSSFLSN